MLHRTVILKQDCLSELLLPKHIFICYLGNKKITQKYDNINL